MTRNLFQKLALLSSLLTVSCAGSNQNVNSPQANADSSQNSVVSITDLDPDGDPLVAQAPVPEDDEFYKNALKFKPEKIELPNAEAFIDDANNGDGDAQFILSMMYRLNIGGVEHIRHGQISENNEIVDLMKEMHRWTQMALESGCLMADYAHGHSLEMTNLEYELGAYQKSRLWLEDAAKNGLPDAEFVLGIVYYNGIGQAKDVLKGQELIARAAIHGLPIAQYYVGMFYELGMGTSVNIAKSMEWLYKAADANNVDAQLILALKYLDGIDVKKDLQFAELYRSSQENFHAWKKLLNKSNYGCFELVCKFNYDEVSMGSNYDDDCGGESSGEYDEEEEYMRARFESAAADRANSSMPYAADYELSAKWLDRAAQNKANFNSRLLKIQACALSGCHCSLEFDYNARMQYTNEEIHNLYQEYRTTPLVVFALGSYYHHILMNDEAGQDPFNAEKYARDAFELYEEADVAGVELASNMLGDVYYHVSNPDIASALDIPEDNDKALEYYLRGNYSGVAGVAYSAARAALGKDEGEKAVRLFELSGEHGSTSAYYMLGRMYKEGRFVPKDDARAEEYLKRCFKDDDDWLVARSALTLSDIYNSQNKKMDALKYCKIAVESHRFDDVSSELPREYALCTAMLQSLPMIEGLKEALLHEVALESGKKANEFFVYNAAIKPCRDLNKKDKIPVEYRVQECEDIVLPLYEESIQKALRGLTALVIAKTGKADIELIENAYYHVAVFLKRSSTFEGELEQHSPIPKEIKDFADGMVYDFYGISKQMYNIWYLRQIPYVAKDVFERVENSGTWDSYLKKAEEVIAKDKRLETGFGIDLLK